MKTINEKLDLDIDAVLEALIEEESREIELMEASLDENFDETSMALGQLNFIEYACDEISEWIEDTDDMPEWFQNKLTMAFAQIQSLHAYVEGESHDDDEEEDEDDIEESTKAYAATMRQQQIDRQRKSMKPGDLDKLAKIRAMLDKEKKKK